MAYLAESGSGSGSGSESGVVLGPVKVELVQEAFTTADAVEAMRGAHAELDATDERAKALIRTAVADVDRFARTGDKKAFIENCLSVVEDLPLTYKAAKQFDDRLHQLTMESLQMQLDTPEQKRTAHAMTLLSQSFAVKTQAHEKVERVIEEFKIATKGEFQTQKHRERAIQTYLAVAKLKLEPKKPDENTNDAEELKLELRELDGNSNDADMRDDLQVRRAQKVAKELEKASGLGANKTLRRAAGVAATASIFFTAYAAPAAASELSVQSSTVQSEQTAVTVVAPSEAAADADTVLPTGIQVSPVQGGESSAVVIIQQPEDEAADLPEMHVAIQPVSTDTVTESAVIIQEPEPAQTEVPVTAVTLVPVQQPAETAEGETLTEATPEAVVVVAEPAMAEESEAPASPVEVQVAPQAESAGPTESDEPIVVTEAEGVVPDANPNPKEGETTEQTIDRLAQSRDMDMTTYKILTTYSPKYEANKDEYLDALTPPNATLDKWMKDKREKLVEAITEAAHDEDYTHKAILAIAYLNAAQKDPSILEHEEVQGFIVGLPDMGEEYQDKLYAKYLGRAEKLLASEDYGSGEGFDEETRAALAMLYAYVDLAQLDGAAQTEKIDEIKAAEEAERQRQEEERRRQEAERQRQEAEQQKQAGYSDAAIAAGEKVAAEYDAKIDAMITGFDLNNAKKEGFMHDVADSLETLDPDELPVNIPMSFAQTIHETGWGQSTLNIKYGNYHGIKAPSTYTGETVVLPTHEYVDGKRVEIDARWIVFENYAESLDYYAHNLIGALPRYANAVKAKDDPYKYIEEVIKGGYATDPDYVLRVTDIADQYTIDLVALVYEKEEAVQKAMDKVKAAEAAAAKQKAEEEERRRQEEAAKKKAEEEERHRREHEGDIRSELADGEAIKTKLMDKYNNVSGKLSSSELASTSGLNKYGEKITIQLHPEAMKGYKALAKAFEKEFGREMRINDSYRDFERQVRLERELDTAGKAGTSNHGWGLAIDIHGVGEGTKEQEWLEANSYKYGFVNPWWAHKDGPKPEAWHQEFFGEDAERRMSEDD